MRKILVAEDDEFLGKIYNSKLSHVGFDVRVANDGVEALNLLSQFTPDLILLDLIMPKLDGFVVLKELKANEKWKNIPVIVTSNLGQPGDKVKAMQLGALEFVVKSDVSLNGMVEMIKGRLKP